MRAIRTHSVPLACSAGTGSYCQMGELNTRVVAVRSLLQTEAAWRAQAWREAPGKWVAMVCTCPPMLASLQPMPPMIPHPLIHDPLFHYCTPT